MNNTKKKKKKSSCNFHSRSTQNALYSALGRSLEGIYSFNQNISNEEEPFSLVHDLVADPEHDLYSPLKGILEHPFQADFLTFKSL